MSVGVVVVGTGFGCLTHVRALRAAGFDVRAVVGRDPEKTATRARAFDVPLGLTSLEEALDLPGVDAVTIATPPLLHAPMALGAIARGMHVLCEKPLARDASEARVMLDAAERAGVVHLMGTEFRFDPGQALLARVVRSGAIGDPKLAMFVLHVPILAAADSDVPEWWADADAGGGWLGAHGSQVIDQVRVTLGELRSVTASVLHVTPRSWTADDGFCVQFSTRSGAVGVMQSTASDRGPMLIETRVIGSTGTAWLEGLSDRVQLADASGSRRVDVPDDLRTPSASEPLPEGLLMSSYERMTGHGLDFGAYARLAEHFMARIRGGAPPPGPQPATFADGVADMVALDAMRRSAADRSTVVLDS